MSKTKSKDLLEHLLSLNERAKAGVFGDCEVIINSKDHDPPHVHLLKSGKKVAKIEIPTDKVKRISDLNITKESAYEDYIITDFIKWINSSDNKLKSSSVSICWFLWNSLHNIVDD